MALQVDYLSKNPQLKAMQSTGQLAMQIRAKHLANEQALDWIAAQTAMIIGFENGRPGESGLHDQALAFAKRDAKNSQSQIKFVTKLGDKLGALRSVGPRRFEADENIQAVYVPGKNLFDRYGGEVFEIDTEDPTDQLDQDTQKKASEKNPVELKAEDERQVALAEALRWTMAISS